MNLKEEILNILDTEIALKKSDSTEKEIITASEQIEKFVESNYYPKEFTEWCIKDVIKDRFGKYVLIETIDYFETLPELFTYWKDNVK